MIGSHCTLVSSLSALPAGFGQAKLAPMRKALLLITILPLLGGCVVESAAKTAVDVVSVPVKVAAAGVNAVVPSQKKADQKRGRELRKEEEQRGKEIRLAQERCRKGRQLPGDQCPSETQR